MTDENNFSDQRNDHLDVIGMVSNVVASYVSNHTVEPSEIPNLIQQITRNLCRGDPTRPYFLISPSHPAVPVKESIKPDYIVCLEDGKQMKMLKRHLKSYYGMTPDQYRQRWGLPVNYPMVAPNYSKKRQGIALSVGLGNNGKGKAA